MQYRSVRRAIEFGVLALGLAACAGKDADGDPDGYLAGIPEQGALELSITGDAVAEGLATDDDALAAALVGDALGSVGLALDAPMADGLMRPRQAMRELNEALRHFLQPIAALVRNVEPSEVEANVATWGPVTRGTTEYRLFVRRGLLRRYGWLLQARPAGDTGEFANVAAGGIQVGTVVRRGRGTVGVDLSALAEVDPTVAARGKVLASFAHGPRGTVLSYGLREFSAGAGDTSPIDAAFQGVHLTGGYNRVRLAFHGNLPETATAAEELVLARVRHHRGEGGRSDLIATGGDIADGKLWVVSECWSAELGSAYRRVLECPGDGIGGASCVEQSSAGDASACLRDLVLPEFPPRDAEELMDDDESPEPDLVPPLDLPTGEAPAE